MDDDRIDYVIVLERRTESSRKARHIVRFIRSLEERGLTIQIKYGKAVKENVYVAVSIPSREVLESLADTYKINIRSPGHMYLPHSVTDFLECRLFRTPLSNGKDLFRRQVSRSATTTERILIVEKILAEAKFGENENEVGLEKLVAFDLAKDAYPLHDGDYDPGDGSGGYPIPENDRQLLLKYWANWALWYKQQPLNLIQKYYGSEVAFYFAWVGFYNKMLIPAAVLGVVCSVGSILDLLVLFEERVDDICNSKLMMCPLCHSGTNCYFQPLNVSCDYAKISIIFDNRFTVFFAIFMSFWATIFLNLWTRLQNTLKIQWNIEFDEIDTETRTEYIERCTHRRWSLLTEKLEPYTPPVHKIIYRALSYGTCLLLAAAVVLFLLAVISYRVQMATIIRIGGGQDLHKHSYFLLSLSSSLLQVFFIKLFSLFLTRLSEWLTRLENPRTQTEFDRSVVHKRYFLGFSNNYASLFYIAFVKGRFYSPAKPTSVARFENDICHPTGCLMSLCLQLSVLMLFQSIAGNVVSLIMPKIGKKRPDDGEDQWEKEYRLKPTSRYLLIDDYMEIIIQYGFVTFFVAAFPLAPLCALLSSCFELRSDAYKLLTRYRRPVPRQQNGIGAWNGILTLITRVSVATNAFVLAFASDFVGREIYKFDNEGSLSGYLRSTLSIYDMRDFSGPLEGEIPSHPTTNSTVCYYQAMRYPPKHRHKYQLTHTYWFHIGMKLLCVIVFEHLIMILNGILAYFIPELPNTVKETLHHERSKTLEVKFKAKNANAPKVRKRTTTVNLRPWAR